MRKFLVLFVLVSTLSICVNGQTFRPLTYEDYARPLREKTDAHNRAMKDINDLSTLIIRFLDDDIDQQLRQELSADLLKLDSISKDLSEHGISTKIQKNIDDVILSIRKELESYKNRTDGIISKRRENEEIASTTPQSWTGSGFALKDGYIITNYHVIDGAKAITVVGINGSFSTEYKATVFASDYRSDLALLKISDSRFYGFGSIPYSVKLGQADVGEDVYVLGYPLTSVMGDELKLTTGVISSMTGFQGDATSYQISAPIQPGNSGGPLFNAKGDVIGVINAKISRAENVSYAIKSTYIKQLVDNCASSSIIPSTNAVASQSRPNQIKSLRDFVFLIKCSRDTKDNLFTSLSTQSSKTSPNPSSNKSSSSRKSIFQESLSSNTSSIEVQNISIQVGERFELETDFAFVSKWETDNSNIVMVDDNGFLIGKSEGKTDVWAYYLPGDTYGGLKRFRVTVESSSLSVSTSAYHPKRTITGTVRSSTTNKPIVGVRVQSSLTENAFTITDSNGHYSFNVVEGDTLTFMDSRHEAVSIAIDSNSTIDVTLHIK